MKAQLIRIYPCDCVYPGHALRVEYLEEDFPYFPHPFFTLVLYPDRISLKNRIIMAIKLLFGEQPLQFHEIVLNEQNIKDMIEFMEKMMEKSDGQEPELELKSHS